MKLHLNGLIEKPITALHKQTLDSVLKMCAERQFTFRTFPVVGESNQLVGLLTQNDFDFCSDMSKPVAQAMTPITEVVSAPAATAIKEAYNLMNRHKKKTLPLVNSDGTVAGLYILSDVSRIVRNHSGRYNVDEKGRLRVAAAVPTDDEAITRVREMRKSG